MDPPLTYTHTQNGCPHAADEAEDEDDDDAHVSCAIATLEKRFTLPVFLACTVS